MSALDALKLKYQTLLGQFDDLGMFYVQIYDGDWEEIDLAVFYPKAIKELPWALAEYDEYSEAFPAENIPLEHFKMDCRGYATEAEAEEAGAISEQMKKLEAEICQVDPNYFSEMDRLKAQETR